jgi:hypothetical protein
MDATTMLDRATALPESIAEILPRHTTGTQRGTDNDSVAIVRSDLEFPREQPKWGDDDYNDDSLCTFSHATH